MVNLVKSKAISWCALILMVILVVLTALLHAPWWSYIDVFFAFLMAFFHLLAVYMAKATAISHKLDLWAFIFMICAVIGFIAEYFITV